MGAMVSDFPGEIFLLNIAMKCDSRLSVSEVGLEVCDVSRLGCPGQWHFVDFPDEQVSLGGDS